MLDAILLMVGTTFVLLVGYEIGYWFGHAKGSNPNNAAVVISHFWEGDQLRAGVFIRRGNIGRSVYDFPADEQGEARASLHGRDLAEIAGLPLCDRRATSGEGNKP